MEKEKFKENKRKMKRRFKTVATIEVVAFGDPPHLKVDMPEHFKVKKDEQVAVILPEVFLERTGRKMPRLIIHIYVSKTQDEQTLDYFVSMVLQNIKEYEKFWNERYAEAQTGIQFPALNS